MDELGFSYEVQAPGPPFEKQPIPLVGWKDDPQHQQLSEEIASAIEAGDEAALSRTLDRQAVLRRPLLLREYVNRALAVFIAPHDYSYRELTLAVAQQIGNSHEDESVDEPLVQMGTILIGGSPAYVAPLIPFGSLSWQSEPTSYALRRRSFSYEAAFLNLTSPSN